MYTNSYTEVIRMCFDLQKIRLILYGMSVQKPKRENEFAEGVVFAFILLFTLNVLPHLQLLAG